jgi:hypothetical protein
MQWGILLFSLRKARRTIFVSLFPMSDLSIISSTNIRWLPTPYPKGITHTLAILILLDTHSLSIGLLPLKNVAPVHFPVCCRTASFSARPEVLTKALPRGPLYVCLLWSMKRIILSPAARHLASWCRRWTQNSLLGQVRFWCSMIKYCRCCWYIVQESFLLFLHMLYATMTLVRCPCCRCRVSRTTFPIRMGLYRPQRYILWCCQRLPFLCLPPELWPCRGAHCDSQPPGMPPPTETFA